MNSFFAWKLPPLHISRNTYLCSAHCQFRNQHYIKVIQVLPLFLSSYLNLSHTEVSMNIHVHCIWSFGFSKQKFVTVKNWKNKKQIVHVFALLGALKLSISYKKFWGGISQRKGVTYFASFVKKCIWKG